MKKFILSLVLLTVVIPLKANAETIVIVDDNNVVKQQIYTQPMGTQVYTNQPVYAAPQPVYVQPQQVYVQQPPQQVVVVRETVRPRTYYYDSTATALFAGFTGAVVGNALFRHHHHGHHHGGHHHH